MGDSGSGWKSRHWACGRGRRPLKTICGGRLDGLRFRRQHALVRFIVDFYCVKAALVLEVDGPIHEGQQEADAERKAYLEALGLTVLRYTNAQVLTNVQAVVDAIHIAAVKKP